MDLQPATFAQLQRLRNGQTVVVEEDVGSVIQQLREIDSKLNVRFSEDAGVFVVYGEDKCGRQYLVATADALDQRLVDQIRLVGSDDYDFATEIEKGEAEAERRRLDEFAQQIGLHGERLWHAARKDRGIQDRIFLPRGI